MLVTMKYSEGTTGVNEVILCASSCVLRCAMYEWHASKSKGMQERLEWQINYLKCS